MSNTYVYICFVFSEPPEFAVVDFEFTQLGKENLILISGAVCGHYEPLVTKFEGRALKLRTNEPVTTREWKAMVHHLVNIFKGKPKKLFPILAQIYDSDHTSCPNLTRTTIQTILNKYNSIILWEGSTDIKILNALHIRCRALTMRGWDTNNNGNFDLQLTDMLTKQSICSIKIGTFVKQGRALKLSEAHELLCKKTHGFSEAHDPRTDVLWTRCLFRKLQLEFHDLIKNTIGC